MTFKPTCTTGCQNYEDASKCPYNRERPETDTEARKHMHECLRLAGLCPVEEAEQVKEQWKKRRQREKERATCPDCKSTDSRVVSSRACGTIRFGSSVPMSHIRQCKKCKTIWED